jgi:hypothetical protein
VRGDRPDAADGPESVLDAPGLDGGGRRLYSRLLSYRGVEYVDDGHGDDTDFEERPREKLDEEAADPEDLDEATVVGEGHDADDINEVLDDRLDELDEAESTWVHAVEGADPTE